jgi:hypothetical protein
MSPFGGERAEGSERAEWSSATFGGAVETMIVTKKGIW